MSFTDKKEIGLGRCIVIGAGDFAGLRDVPSPGDLLIAADAGIKKFFSLGLVPDLILGDFDSLDSAPESLPIKKGTEILRFPIEKDDTDMMLAVKEGLKRGYRHFELYGGAGGQRVDHLLANIQTLAYLSKRGAKGSLYGTDYLITTITDDSIELTARFGATLSVFAHGGPAEGVTLSGVKYTLYAATLTPDFPLGVSNEARADKIFIEVKRGTLIVVLFY